MNGELTEPWAGRRRSFTRQLESEGQGGRVEHLLLQNRPSDASLFFFIWLILIFAHVHQPFFSSSGSQRLTMGFAVEAHLFAIVFGMTSLLMVRGGELYDPAKETCCLGAVANASGCWSSGCCGAVPFDYTTDICCQNRILPLLHGMKTACCGNATYNVQEEVCCSNQDVVAVPAALRCSRAGTLACCASEVYSTEAQLCCAGVRHPKPAWNSVCCGDAVYAPGERSCCNATVYNPNEQLCCRKQLLLRASPKEQCCGNRSHDFETQVCCGGQVLPKPPPGTGCCGAELFDYGAAMCCDERVVNSSRPSDGCCGSAAYDAVAEMCCDGAVVPRAGRNVTCCGTRAFNGHEELCCDGGVHRKLASGELRCCGRGVHDPLTTVCCDGEALLKTVLKHECCSDRSANAVVPVGALLLRGWRPVHEVRRDDGDADFDS